MRTSTRTLLLLVAALSISCSHAKAGREYDNSDLQLVTGYAAKEYCSCIFVMEQTEDFCNRWTRANPQVTSVRLDRQEKTVQSSALVMWGARARYTGPRFGCVLE